ncbi:alanine racemase [Evansella caseinilytica]|uniref:Alanine racemase n=1 Tax=Evansella caseinilytica TaxID=1503961 RepID=A0A1H3QIP0_9BACI|nr:alanine racemase [Evansella caseinilytica]
MLEVGIHMHDSTGDLFYRDTWVEVDLDAIEANVRQLKKLLPSNVQVMAVVKANGYGHGAVQVAEAAMEAGADMLGVALLDEALALRKAGIVAPILVLGYVRPENADLAAENNIAVTVFQREWLEKAAAATKSQQKITCHIKIDTGMGRLGIRTAEEGKALVNLLKKYPFFEVQGIFTHFATADELNTSYQENQQKLFAAAVAEIERLLEKEIPVKHCSNSAAALRFSDQYYNLIRFGISMYGLSPSREIKPLLPFPLQEAFSLHSKITRVKQMPEGAGISYGATYKTSEEEWIGTIPIGYADGWIRANSGGEVLVKGKKATIVGRICMDQLMITLPEKVDVGTVVTLIGKQGSVRISMDDVAARLNTINYEIPCTITARVPRVYRKNGKVIDCENNVFPS